VEDFGKSNKTKHGIGSVCLPCLAMISREKRKDPENKKKTAAYAIQYNIENREYIKEKNRLNYIENKHMILGRNKEWRDNNKDHVKQMGVDYCRNNKDLVNAWNHNRRARIYNALHPDHNVDIERVYHNMAIRVKTCLGIDYHVDHILPLNSGGFHHHGNLQVIPGRINIVKSDNIEYTNPILIHWIELPDFLIEHIKE
jgi:hypothetical protein